MKRLRLFLGPGNTQAELDALSKKIHEEITAGQEKQGIVVHDYKIAMSDDVGGSLDGTEGSVWTKSNVIVGVVYTKEKLEEKKE